MASTTQEPRRAARPAAGTRERARDAAALYVLLALALAHPAVADTGRCDELGARLVSVEGNVRVADRPARMGEAICSGETLSVGARSRAAVRLEKTQTVVRIDQHSALVIESSRTDRSWLTLLRGALHLFSRRPAALQVDTPYINAAIDGTEFALETSPVRSEVTVIEGEVLASNALGRVRLAPGETASAGPERGSPHRRIVVDPLDAVQWALHYPPIGASENTSAQVRQAAAYLRTGDVERARQLIERAPEDAASLALESMIAVTQNRPLEAMHAARRAVNADSGSSVAYTALSYAQQARFDIEQALASARVAVGKDPLASHALARQAELELGVDDTARALESAQKAIVAARATSRAHTVLGFVRLVRLEIEAARAAFAGAIERDAGDPLPRLGLGLALIREGRLREGREHIEVAASLDPANALVRSYLGKAYAEERENDDARAQFALARGLDPQDPTAWLYEALLDQAMNRPVSAYLSVERARALNDNRLVYHSRLLLDKSAAAGSLSLARIYTDLGFEQPAINASTRSIAEDPTNFSAYRFLADSYAERPRRGRARRAALFQAALLQPMGTLPVQPYAQASDLLILPGTDPVHTSINEYSPLFDREGFELAGSLVAGNHRTFGDNLVFSALHGRFLYGLGQFHYETDGYRFNNDIAHDIYHGFAQAQLTPRLFLQTELEERRTDWGNIDLLLGPEAFEDDVRHESDTTSPRVGLRAEFGPRSTLMVSARTIERDLSARIQLPDLEFRVLRAIEGHEGSARLTHRTTRTDHSVGVDTHALDIETALAFDSPVDPFPVDDPDREERRYTSYYYYLEQETSRRLHWTLGLSYTALDDSPPFGRKALLGPKLGVRWMPAPSQEWRAALGRGVHGDGLAALTLEPLTLAGFPRVHDDLAGTEAVNAGLAYDWHVNASTLLGLEFVRRTLEVPLRIFRATTGEAIRVEQSGTESTARAYWNQILNPTLSLDIAFLYERLEHDDTRDRDDFPVSAEPLDIQTLSLPVGVHYAHPSGFFAQGEVSFVHQSVEDYDFGTAAVPTFSRERGTEWLTNIDMSLGLKLPTRRATFRIDVNNLLGASHRLRERNALLPENTGARYAPDRSIVARVSFSLR